jgi:hypothetical membrane protein
VNDSLTAAIWVAQGIVLVAILLRDVWHRDWMRIAGAAAGLAVGALPVALPGLIPSSAFYFFLFFAPVVLTVAYGVRRRGVAFALALAFLGSLAYIPLIGTLLPSRGVPVPEIFGMLFELYFYYSPIVTALAGREAFACIDSYRLKERAV